MDDSSDDSYQVKAEVKPVIPNMSFLKDFSISLTNSSDSDEEQPCLTSCKVKAAWSPPHSSTTKASTPKTNNSKINSTWTRELQECQAKTNNQGAVKQTREIQESKLTNAILNYSTESSNTDLEDPTGCTSPGTHLQYKENTFNSKLWTMKDIIKLLEGMKKQLPKMDNKGCLHTAKKINWDKIAFDWFTAEDCKKEFEVLLSNIKLVKTMTAVINEMEEKIPSGKLKAFLILQPRQQFVRDFAEKNKGMVSGLELFAASAEAWRKLSPEEKEQYNRDYILAKEKEIACMSGDEPPVRPKIPFELYYEELCKKKGKKNLELKAIAREKYKNLDAKKKIRYIALSAIELYTFELQVAKYLQKQPDWIVPTQRGPSKEDSEMYLRSLGMPSRPPNTASLLYYHLKMKEGKFNNVHGTTRLFYAIEQFRKLSDHKKRKYKQKHKEMVHEYSVEYEKWRKKQNEVVQRLADKLLGKKQVLPCGTLFRLHQQSMEKDETSLPERKLDRNDSLCCEEERSCCRHPTEYESEKQPAESLCNKNLPSPDLQKLRKICKQEVFFNVEQPLEAKMEKIMLMLSGYEYLPSKVRQRFDNAFKKWKYSLQAAITVDVRRLDVYERQEFLLKYRSVCKRFFKHDIFSTFSD